MTTDDYKKQELLVILNSNFWKKLQYFLSWCILVICNDRELIEKSLSRDFAVQIRFGIY
jgi:hypothetical protein